MYIHARILNEQIFSKFSFVQIYHEISINLQKVCLVCKKYKKCVKLI